MNQLFTDGGVIGRNPSTKGGTWAFRILTCGIVVTEKSGYVTPDQMGMPNITNNLTEMLALLYGVEALPNDWDGTILSDSQITLGRWFLGWKWKNIPQWLVDRHVKAKMNHKYSDWWKWILLQGHPTKADLIRGTGSKGYPVSEHNLWCDKACGKEALNYFQEAEPEFLKESLSNETD